MSTSAPQWQQLIGSTPEQVSNHLAQLSAKARRNLWTDAQHAVLFGDHNTEEDELLDELVDQLGPGGKWEAE